MPGAGFLRVGRVGLPHGLDGSFLVVEPTAGVFKVGAAIGLGGPSADGEPPPTRTIVRVAGHERRVIVRFAGCEDRTAAEALRGTELYVDRSAVPPLGADEWWAEDLEGCAVHDGAVSVGTVRRLLALPSCEVLEVERADGAADLLVPLVSDAVRTVDIEAKQIDIDLAFLGEAAS